MNRLAKSFFAVYLAAALLPFISSAAFEAPGRPSGFVNDFAGLLSASDKAVLESKLSAFNSSTTIEIAIVTLPSLGGDDIETAARKIFDSWKIGKAKEDNGVLLIVAPNERKIRIEVGYGLEGALTDLQSSWVIQNTMAPAFQKGDYYGGLNEATDEIMADVKGEAKIPSGSNSKNSFSGILNSWFLPLAVVFVFQILASVLGRTKSFWLGGALGGLVGVVILLVEGVAIGILAIILLTLFGLLFDYIVSRRPPGSGGPGGFWGGFGGGGGSGGGGFGGFGGGGSGGGGSSGSY